jgi:hypothetical protein
MVWGQIHINDCTLSSDKTVNIASAPLRQAYIIAPFSPGFNCSMLHAIETTASTAKIIDTIG